MPIFASTHDGSHPRPTLMRDGWQSLDGPWDFAYDDADLGRAAHWYTPGITGGARRHAAPGSTNTGALAATDPFDRTIEVPFVPESEASGIGDESFHPIVWYRRGLPIRPEPGHRVLLHFGAVDHEAQVWVDGQLAGHHVGGQTAFTLDITDLLDERAEHVLVVRAFDDPHDPELPRGKQDWLEQTHGIWYHRSTGIWRSVWIESVPEQHVTAYRWDFDMARAAVDLTVDLAHRPTGGAGGATGAGPATEVRVSVLHDGERLASVQAGAREARVDMSVGLPQVRNTQGRDHLLWRPEHPVLLDLLIETIEGGEVIDVATGYLGLRTCGIDRGHFLLNEEPYYVRSVLEQGYWPTSQLTAPSAEAYRREVELIKELGFNAARIHQKVEDPRMLFWADRLGLLVWGETANAYAFSPRAAQALMSEWGEIVAQCRTHPAVVTWVPINESWGVRDLAIDDAQRAFTRAITEYTRALDPTRPVVSNDGYELVGGDVIALHDYTTDEHVLRERYASPASTAEAVASRGAQGRRPINDEARDPVREGAPVMITEFGGIAFASGDTWGYATVEDEDAFAAKVGGLIAAVEASPTLAGSCYTQLTDTLQEANGLLTADREPKLPIEQLRAIVTGRG